jgi:hypothetical protein
MAVDAALDPGSLRQRYPDPARHAICRGTIRMRLRRHDADGHRLNPPELAGWVEGLAPSVIYVPRPVNQLLTTLHQTFADPDEDAGSHPPRFLARVHWGKNYAPWIDKIQAVPEPSPKSRYDRSERGL